MTGSNSASLCGLTNWRVPTLRELASIARHNASPAIDTGYFPNTPAAPFWSATPNASTNTQAWAFTFDQGGSSSLPRTRSAVVRLVSGTWEGTDDAAVTVSAPQIHAPWAANRTPASRYTVNNNGTVTDTATGLMWQQCSAGLSGNACGVGSASSFTWQQALEHAAASTLAASLRLASAQHHRATLHRRPGSTHPGDCSAVLPRHPGRQLLERHPPRHRRQQHRPWLWRRQRTDRQSQPHLPRTPGTHRRPPQRHPRPPAGPDRHPRQRHHRNHLVSAPGCHLVSPLQRHHSRWHLQRNRLWHNPHLHPCQPRTAHRCPLSGRRLHQPGPRQLLAPVGDHQHAHRAATAHRPGHHRHRRGHRSGMERRRNGRPL